MVGSQAIEAREQYQDALKKAANAYYHYSDLDDMTKRLEKRYISPELKKDTAPLIFLIKLVVDKQLTVRYTW